MFKCPITAEAGSGAEGKRRFAANFIENPGGAGIQRLNPQVTIEVGWRARYLTDASFFLPDQIFSLVSRRAQFEQRQGNPCPILKTSQKIPPTTQLIHQISRR